MSWFGVMINVLYIDVADVSTLISMNREARLYIEPINPGSCILRQGNFILSFLATM